jgi:hypothetical protein
MTPARARANGAASIPPARHTPHPKRPYAPRGYAATAHVEDHARVDELIGVEEIAVFFHL